ncbi:MAG TPA: exopolysaccharide Pel transporter PelG [Nevskiaceae bacterium]|nr:exopolysaccharide Pel transporter PelG [Nevskiaceae bacterium]
MAGVGVELRKLLRTQTYTGLLRSYGYAGIISSGPWVLSIFTIMVLGLGVNLVGHVSTHGVDAFLVSVTYLVAVSLIVSGLVQLVYTRFVADRLFAGQRGAVLPNLVGLLLGGNLVSGVSGAIVILTLFGGTPVLYRLEMFTSYVVLCNIWLLTVFLAGMKDYMAVVWCFVAGYGTVLVGGLLLRGYGLVGLPGAFTVGQAVLLFAMLWLVLRDYESDRLVAFDLLRRGLSYPSLIFTGFFYNFGIWIDKFMFWYNPHTSIPVIGPLRASPIYDFPIFLAYLAIVPGMAVFLVRMETDFAERYDRYYDALRDGDTLKHMETFRSDMVDTARQGIYEIFKIQGITTAILLLLAPTLMRLLGFSQLYVPLFDIDLVGVGLQVLLLAILNTLFYLNKLMIALALCATFAIGNLLLTSLSQWLGVAFYGYGFTISLGVASLLGLALLSRQFERLTYFTFMFQPGPTGIVDREAVENRTARREARRGMRHRTVD